MSELFGMQVEPPALGDVALGLASVLARFDRLLDAYAPPRAVAGEADDATFAVLGLVALRAQLGRMLDDARGPAGSAAAAVTAQPGGSLLR